MTTIEFDPLQPWPPYKNGSLDLDQRLVSLDLLVDLVEVRKYLYRQTYSDLGHAREMGDHLEIETLSKQLSQQKKELDELLDVLGPITPGEPTFVFF